MKSINKDMIKAIRTVKGWTSDLRKSLTACNKDCLYSWIEENRITVIGPEMAIKPNPCSDEWDDYERQIWHVVHQVITGK